MSGERDFETLLRSLAPELIDGEYVFCTFEGAQYGDRADLEPIAALQEREGLTLVIPRAKAEEQHLPYESVFCGITLTVHSSLDAVGLTAAIATQLTQYNISANVIAGYFHDHIFVPCDQAETAIAALHTLAQSSRSRAQQS
jgi:hypothetical protein